MSDKQAVTVRIAGEEHIIRASAPPEYTRACAKVVDERIMEIRTKAGLLDPHKSTILAALSIADELLQARDELARLRQTVSQRTLSLNEQLQTILHD